MVLCLKGVTVAEAFEFSYLGNIYIRTLVAKEDKLGLLNRVLVFKA